MRGYTKFTTACMAGLLLLLASLTLRPATARPAASGRVFVPLAAGKVAFGATAIPGTYNEVTAITHAGDDRLFIGEREGRVKILHPDGRVTVFLDIRHRVIASRGEYGFYDIAFHPGYADPASPGYGFFYVSFTSGTDERAAGGAAAVDVDLIVARFRVSADPNVANPASEVPLLVVPQTDDIHKGGAMEIDPRTDRLFVGVGDDFKNLIAQDPGSPKGKILRLAVDEAPRDAPPYQLYPVTTEVWASGLRNPWRIDVDPLGDQLLIGEVGDADWEEVNRAPLSAPGANFGWPCLEGPLVKPSFSGAAACQNPERFERPVHAYSHRDTDNNRCVIIGGKVYRPAGNPTDGRYIFADLCSREVFALGYDADGSWPRTLLGVVGNELINTIGEDRYGTQYIGTAARGGVIWRLSIP
ncbi:MAG TPA: PQQ-dependent sugar dehydrogenase [Promineifilum sp.]|mgnify:FL=1|nr:PQQ-dependent sugar dehydrogenase [Promineifilum sp.]